MRPDESSDIEVIDTPEQPTLTLEGELERFFRQAGSGLTQAAFEQFLAECEDERRGGSLSFRRDIEECLAIHDVLFSNADDRDAEEKDDV